MSRSNPKPEPVKKKRAKKPEVDAENVIRTRSSAEFFRVCAMEKEGAIIIRSLIPGTGMNKAGYKFLVTRTKPKGTL